MKIHYSPLRYPGGKGKLANYIKMVIEQNQLKGGYYIEPYAGGASIALDLLINKYASKILINDIDKSIYAFWHSVVNETDALCELIKKTRININSWKNQKTIQTQKDTRSLIKLGFSTFFLNRTNHSGIINGGVIGGVDQSGIWKINARYNKKVLIERIKTIAALKDKIEIYNLDACKFLDIADAISPQKSLFYLDPPYYVKGKALYVNHYSEEDHAVVAKHIKEMSNRNWIVSYDYVPQIIKLYNEFRKKIYTINYSVSKHSKKGKEVIIFSNNLNVPSIKNPLKANKLKLLPCNCDCIKNSGDTIHNSKLKLPSYHFQR